MLKPISEYWIRCEIFSLKLLCVTTKRNKMDLLTKCVCMLWFVITIREISAQVAKKEWHLPLRTLKPLVIDQYKDVDPRGEEMSFLLGHWSVFPIGGWNLVAISLSQISSHRTLCYPKSYFRIWNVKQCTFRRIQTHIHVPHNLCSCLHLLREKLRRSHPYTNEIHSKHKI